MHNRFGSSEDYLVSDFFDDVDELSKIKKLKIIDELLKVQTRDLIRRNWKLVLLDIQNLVLHQTKKIDEKVENPKKTMNNMGAHKLLNESGISNIDLLKAKMLFKNIKL